jgi:hypothetical protein
VEGNFQENAEQAVSPMLKDLSLRP